LLEADKSNEDAMRDITLTMEKEVQSEKSTRRQQQYADVLDELTLLLEQIRTRGNDV
jgi:hypothetical protein